MGKYDGAITVGVLGALGYAYYRLFKWVDKNEKEKKEKEELFEAYKEQAIIDNDIWNKQMMCTLENTNLSEVDRAFVYEYSKAFTVLIKAATTEDGVNKRITEFDNFFSKLMSDDKTAVKAYIRYLKKITDDKKAEKASRLEKEMEDRRAEHEMEKLRLQIKSDERKADTVVRGIEAIAGSNKQSDVNVTVNNDNK